MARRHPTPAPWSASTVPRPPRKRPASPSTKHPGAGWALLLCTPGATWDHSASTGPHVEWRNIKDAEEDLLAERLSGWRERYPDIAVRGIVVCDHPSLRLLEQAERAQLVVLGSHGRGGFAGMLLGSVWSAVVHNAGVPVIIARPPNSTDPAPSWPAFAACVSGGGAHRRRTMVVWVPRLMSV